MNNFSQQTSSILPMNVEVDFIKKALDAGLYKQTTRITSDIFIGSMQAGSLFSRIF